MLTQSLIQTEAAGETGIDSAADIGLPESEFARDLRAALAERPRRISPKYFYDAPGSRLFDQRCGCCWTR